MLLVDKPKVDGGFREITIIDEEAKVQMERKLTSLFVAILVALAAISYAVLAVQAHGEKLANAAAYKGDTSSPSLDIIIINNEGYERDRKGPVTFTHRKHALDYGVSCWKCHHDYEDGKNLWSPWGETLKCSECHMPSEDVDNVMNLQKAFHERCKNCHRELAKEKKKTGPYRKCYGCHAKKK